MVFGSVVAGVAFVACAQEHTDQPGAAAGQDTKIVLWIEVNTRSDSALDDAVDGLTAWSKLTDTMIVSVDAGRVGFYKSLKERLPDLTIIPGIKTSPVLGHRGFDSVEKWKVLADDVSDACKMTGSEFFVFENEKALEAYYKGKCALDFEKLAEALGQLPRHVKYLWYPSAAGAGETLERYIKLDRVVEKALDVRFLDHATLYSPRSHGQPATTRAVTPLEALAKEKTIPLIYCCGERWWPYERIPEALTLAAGKWGKHRWSVVYPGQGRWIDSARSIEEALRKSAKTPAP